MTTYAGKRCDVYVTAGAPVSMTSEAMSDISASGFTARTTYAVTNAVKRYFDRSQALTFERSLNSGGSWSPVTPDLVTMGFIQFTAQQQLSPLAMFRVTGFYLPYTRFAGGHDWEANPQADLNDETEFMQNSKNYNQGLLGGTVSIKRWWLDDGYRSVLGNKLVVVFYLDATGQPAGPRFEHYAILGADAIKVAVGDNHEEDLTLTLQEAGQFLGA